MRLSWFPFIATCVFLFQASFVSSKDENYLYHRCSSANYTSNSAYKKNLESLLHSLSLDSNKNFGFYNISVGEGDDKVNAIALCRGDLYQDACLGCLRFSLTDLPMLCPSQKDAIVWYGNCMLRYSNQSIFHSVDRTAFYMWNPTNASETGWFSRGLVVGLRSRLYKASSGDSRKKFAVRDTFTDKDTRIYSLMQCTPDLTELQCTNCLERAINDSLPRLSQKTGAVLGPSCNFRYELYQYYEIQSPASSSPPEQSPASSPPELPPPPLPPLWGTIVVPPEGQQITWPKHKRIRNIIVIASSTLGFVALLTGIYILVLLKRRKAKLCSKGHQIFFSTDAHEKRSMESLQFDFETIRVATNNFNNGSKLGQGGFGAVYKGKLAEGKEIAVKRLAAHSGQGDLEFTNEVILLAKLQHRNLVRLLGYCLKGNERLLVYEFVPNSSLDHFLFDSAKRVNLDWEVRYKIINGIAKGVLYLHEDSRLTIIHRDLKTGNILLDEEMCPKIADFGMARLFSLNQTQGDTTRIVGTYGYMAPEYAMHGKFSVKSDVYSFGILLLEIISGQKNSRFSIGDKPHELTSFAWENWKAGAATNIIDPTILEGQTKDILRCIHIGLLCVQDSVVARPTMASVVLMLSSSSIALGFPSKPAIFTSAGFEKALTSSSEDEVCTPSVNQVSVSDMLPR